MKKMTNNVNNATGSNDSNPRGRKSLLAGVCVAVVSMGLVGGELGVFAGAPGGAPGGFPGGPGGPGGARGPSTNPSVMSPKQIMERIFQSAPRGTGLLEKVRDGSGTDADKKLFLEYAKAMASKNPPKGKPDEWKDRTAKILAAAEKVAGGDGDATDELSKATSCKTCHNVFGIREGNER